MQEKVDIFSHQRWQAISEHGGTEHVQAVHEVYRTWKAVQWSVRLLQQTMTVVMVMAGHGKVFDRHDFAVMWRKLLCRPLCVADMQKFCHCDQMC